MGLLALAPVLQEGKSKAEPQKNLPKDAELEAAWTALGPEERTDLAQRFVAEVEWLDTLQAALIAHARELSPVDPGLLEDAPPTPFYDPHVHAPGQPIERTRLKPDHAFAAAERERLVGGVRARKLRSAWQYDWGVRTVQRTGDPEDPDLIFHNALAGYAPGADLAEALIAQALDRGEEQKVLAAFGHAYTDRAGNVFPGITLYDAWGSGQELEMPDVDVLGIIHDMLNEWKKWVAPMPSSQHDKVYEKVGEMYQDARRYRGLRQALAIAYLNGSGELRDSYAGHLIRLHALWESVKSNPVELAPELPDADAGSKFLETWKRKVDRDPKLLNGGAARRAALESDAARIRALAARLVLEARAQSAARAARGEKKRAGG